MGRGSGWAHSELRALSCVRFAFQSGKAKAEEGFFPALRFGGLAPRSRRFLTAASSSRWHFLGSKMSGTERGWVPFFSAPNESGTFAQLFADLRFSSALRRVQSAFFCCSTSGHLAELLLLVG